MVVAYDFNPSTQDRLGYTTKPCLEKLRIKTKQNKKLCSAGLFYERQLAWVDAHSTQSLEWGVKVCCSSNNMWLAPPAYVWRLVSYGPSMFICPVNEIVSGGSGVHCLLEFCAGIKPSASPMVSNISSSEVHPLALPYPLGLCVSIFRCIWMYMETRGQCRASSSITHPAYFLRQDLSVNLEATDWAGLATKTQGPPDSTFAAV